MKNNFQLEDIGKEKSMREREEGGRERERERKRRKTEKRSHTLPTERQDR